MRFFFLTQFALITFKTKASSDIFSSLLMVLTLWNAMAVNGQDSTH